jgi:hypothetical protein
MENGEWGNQESRLRVYIWAKLKPALLRSSDPDSNDRLVDRLPVPSERPCDERKRLQEDCDRPVSLQPSFSGLTWPFTSLSATSGSIQVRLRTVQVLVA